MDSMAVTPRLTDEEMESLRSRAALEGISIEEAVGRAVREWLARGQRREEFQAAADRVLRSHADVIERLGR